MAVVYTPYMAAEKMVSASPHHVLPSPLAPDESPNATAAAPPIVTATPASFAHPKRSRRNRSDRRKVKTQEVVDSTVELDTEVPASAQL